MNIQRDKQVNERGEAIGAAINAVVGNEPNKPNPIGYFCIHFEFLNPDGTVGTITNANTEDIAEILRTILARMTH